MDCGADLPAASLAAHMETKHGWSGRAKNVTTTALIHAPPSGVSGGLPLEGPINKLFSIGLTREAQQSSQSLDAFYAPEFGVHHYNI